MKKAIILCSLILSAFLFASCNAGDDTESITTADESTERSTEVTEETTLTEETTIEEITTVEDTTVFEELATEQVMRPSLIPQPQSFKMGVRYARVEAFVGYGEFENARSTLCYFVKNTHGVTPEIVYDGEAAIRFVKIESFDEEEYRITVSNNAVLIEASDEYGAQNAVSTLVQAMTVEDGLLKIVESVIRDKPDRQFRSVMFDLARSWHETSYIYEYIDMCRFYKIRYLHLHFTDSQLYTLPSDIYPDLSTNGHYYSKETIKEFIDYATLRGVSIIPEIDVPGHSANFHRAYPDVFGNHNIICMSEKSLTAMEALFDELCELFECSEYIHIGGDEASVQNWTTCPDCRNSFKDKGFDVDNMTADELITVMYAEFINRMAKVVQDHGKTPIVWEGFPVEANDLITRDIVVYGWENYYQTTDSLLQAGFTVVNAAWKPLYTVAPKNVSTFDDIVAWNIFTWRAVHPNSPYLNTPLIVEPTDKVIGAQMSCWGDLITTKYPTVNDGLDDEQKLLFSKLPAMAERVWNIDRTLNIGRFRRTFADVSTLFRTFFASINNTHS